MAKTLNNDDTRFSKLIQKFEDIDFSFNKTEKKNSALKGFSFDFRFAYFKIKRFSSSRCFQFSCLIFSIGIVILGIGLT